MNVLLRIAAIVLAVAMLQAPLAADAQRAGKVYRIGWLDPTALGPHIGTFSQGLRDLGWTEGQNFVVEWRGGEGKYEQLARLAAELVRLPVDVIVAPDTASALAAKEATKTIPIVMVWVGDPVGSGLVTSLARPGGNITGMTTILPELGGKQLELLKEAVPGISRVAVLWEPGNPDNQPLYEQLQVAAGRLGLTLQSLKVRDSYDIEPAFSAMIRGRANALIVLESRLTVHNRIADLALERRLPMTSNSYYLTAHGGLMSYVPSVPDSYRRAATYVDKILKGSKPSDLPVEQPTKFELIINLKTARALGLTIPQSILIRTDNVIQ